MNYKEEIAVKLGQLERVVLAAKRENKQGWRITEDLRKLRALMAELENLDHQDGRSRAWPE